MGFLTLKIYIYMGIIVLFITAMENVSKNFYITRLFFENVANY